MGLCLNRSWLDNWIRKFAQKTGFADAKCLEWGYLIQFNDNAFISSRTVGHKWTNQQTNLITHHLKCCFNHSEMPEPKFVIKMIWYNYLLELSHTIAFPNIRHPPPNAVMLYWVCSEAQVINYVGRKSHIGFPVFQQLPFLLLILCAGFPGSDTWDGNTSVLS